MPPSLDPYLLAAWVVLALFLKRAMRPTPLPAPVSTHPVVEARYNWRLALVAFVAGSLLLCFYWLRPDGLHQRVHGIGVSLVVVCLAAIGLVDRRVKLRIDEVGIRYSAWGEVTLHWSELARVQIAKGHAGMSQLRLIPVPGLGARERLPWLPRRRGSLGLSALFLDYGITQLHAVIAEYLYKKR